MPSEFEARMRSGGSDGTGSRLQAGGPAELDTILDDADRALATVRRELDDAWEAAFRGTGVAILAAAVALLAANLLLGLAPAVGTTPAWVNEAIRLVGPGALIAVGLQYLRTPRQLRARQVRTGRWWRRVVAREPVLDSRLADLLDRERSMRREVVSLDQTVTMSTVLLVLVGLALLGLVFVASTDVAHGLGPLPGLWAELLAASAAAVVGLVLGSGRRHLRRGRSASARIAEWDRRLLGIESRFSDWR